MTDHFADVREFHRKFMLDVHPDTPPRFLTRELWQFRMKFLREELAEFTLAHNETHLANAGDALVDLVYVALGTAHLMGLPFNEMFAEVHRANMAKERATSAEDPRSVRKSSFDVVKPVGWQPPDHHSIIQRAMDAHTRLKP